MLSLQLCLSLAPLLAGSDVRHDSFPPVSLRIPYHLIEHPDGRLKATPVALMTDDDDDDDKDRDERRDGQDSRRDREDRRDGEDRKPENRPAEGRRPQPEGLRGRPELRRPDGPGQPPKDGDHRPQPDQKQPPQQGKPPAALHGPPASGGFRPPVLGSPHFGGMFGHGSPFGGGPGKPHLPPVGHGPGSSVLTGIIFELLDQNHDGNLSREEFQKLADAVQKSHHPPMVKPIHSGPGKGPDGVHERPQLSRRPGPPMIHQPFPLLRAHKPDGDHKAESNHRPDGDRDHKPEHDRKPEHGDREEHREHGERDSDRHHPDGERGEKSREHQEPRI